MYEIELKARVADRKSLITALNSFATFSKAVQKDDLYWKTEKDGRKISVRIRREEPFASGEIPAEIAKKTPRQNPQVLLTYKRKEVREGNDGSSIEVNDEKECSISDSKALESLFADLGFSPYLEKHKTVLCWKYQDALLELCTVPPLGDFLEIEVMSPVNDDPDVENIRSRIKSMLAKAGLGEDTIESRYYSEMLAEVKI